MCAHAPVTEPVTEPITLPVQVVVDRPPDQLMLMESATDAVSLQWAPVVCTVHSPPGSMPLPVEYTVHYELQMQQVGRGVGGGRCRGGMGC